MGPETFQNIAASASETTGITVRYDGFSRFSPALGAARFVLDNGLRVVLMPDHRAPVFAYQTWFRVGSRNEASEHTGQAHLLEHLMFKGTLKHPLGELDREMERRGSQTNAATWVDWTFYTQALVASGDHLATVIDFESDRITGLVLDEETFRSELEVVKNERRLSIDDSVGGTINELLYAAIFQSHPYGWATIGAMEHLESATLEELQAFYRMYYAPNNATVVLVGDLDFQDALNRITTAYGTLPAQPLTEYLPAARPVQEEARLIKVTLPVAIPQLSVAYGAVAQSDERYPAAEILCEALVNGESSRLYRRLVIEQNLALDVSGYITPFAEPGVVEFTLQPRAGVSSDTLLEKLQSELKRVGSDAPLSGEEVEKARHSLELGHLMSLKDAEGCAEALGHFESNYNDFSQALEMDRGWAAVDEAQCRRVAAELFRESQRTAVIAENQAAAKGETHE